MDISQVSAAQELMSASSNSRIGGVQSQQISSDMFYKLLAAQLQYQDPMESMDNTQMVLQMAQFATIEQLNNLNSSFGVFMEQSMIQDGAALVGKEVRIGVDSETTIVGTVDKVGFSSAGMLLEVDGEYYEAWRVIEVGNEGTLGEGTAPEEDKEPETE